MTWSKQYSLIGGLNLPSWMCVAGCMVALLILVGSIPAGEIPATSVGMPNRIDQIRLPGSELEVKPLEDRDSPIVLRITGAFRHGTDHRYDMVYYGLEPGDFDLREFLRRKDGTTTDDLPPITARITALLPDEKQIEPNKLESRPAPYLGGYRTLLVLGGIVWVAGLLAILFVGRKKLKLAAGAANRKLSLADRLRPIVERAVAGNITLSQQAQLERMLVAFWRKRLNLDNVKAAEAIVALREHEEAGRLLRQLEVWLHKPGDTGEVDVSALLEPYRDLPAEAIEGEIVNS